MVLNLEQLALPTHILQALRGDYSAVNSIDILAPVKQRTALTRAPVTIQLAHTIDDSEPHEIECIALSELTSYDVLE